MPQSEEYSTASRTLANQGFRSHIMSLLALSLRVCYPNTSTLIEINRLSVHSEARIATLTGVEQRTVAIFLAISIHFGVSRAPGTVTPLALRSGK